MQYSSVCKELQHIAYGLLMAPLQLHCVSPQLTKWLCYLHKYFVLKCSGSIGPRNIRFCWSGLAFVVMHKQMLSHSKSLKGLAKGTPLVWYCCFLYILSWQGLVDWFIGKWYQPPLIVYTDSMPWLLKSFLAQFRSYRPSQFGSGIR